MLRMSDGLLLLTDFLVENGQVVDFVLSPIVNCSFRQGFGGISYSKSLNAYHFENDKVLKSIGKKGIGSLQERFRPLEGSSPFGDVNELPKLKFWLFFHLRSKKRLAEFKCAIAWAAPPSVFYFIEGVGVTS